VARPVIFLVTAQIQVLVVPQEEVSVNVAAILAVEAKSATSVARSDTLLVTAPMVVLEGMEEEPAGTATQGTAADTVVAVDRAVRPAIRAVATVTCPATALKGKNATTVERLVI